MTRAAQVVKLPNAQSRQQWVERVKKAWRGQLANIFETGNLLEGAKAELEHGEWKALFVNNEMPFDLSTANRLIAISNNDTLRNEALAPLLPISWSILYELTKLTDEQFETGLTSRTINARMSKKDAKALRGIEPKQRKEKEQPKLASQQVEPASEPKDLLAWIDEISPQIRRAYHELSEDDRGALYRKARLSAADSVRDLIEAGRRLIAKKDDLNHGEWLPWLEENEDVLGFGVLTAQRLIKGALKYVVNDVCSTEDALQISREIWGHDKIRGTQGTGDNDWNTPEKYIERHRARQGHQHHRRRHREQRT
jgi:hypothetical protein